MKNDPTASEAFPCPVCNDCTHDFRGGLLEFANNVKENFNDAVEQVIEACESSAEDAPDEFAEAMIQLNIVQRQITALLDVVPDLALIKLRAAQQ